MKQKVDLFRDILDQQLVDCKETKRISIIRCSLFHQKRNG